MSDDAEQASVPAAVLAFLTLPAMIGGVIPVGIGLLDPTAGEFTVAGLLLVGGGGLIVVRTVVDFFTVGGGTLAPWDPPRRLVTVGLFSWCRNPMYVGVIVTVLGWTATFWSPLVGGYAALITVGFHVRVVVFEERWAAETFGSTWSEYVDRVPRWPSLRRNRELPSNP